MQKAYQPIEQTETLTLEAAAGRILSHPVVAPVDLPPFYASAMDGYAIHSPSTDGCYIQIAESFAGHPYLGEVAEGECVRVYTGALVPPTATRVVIQEQASQLDERKIQLQFDPHEESYIRPPGHDVHKGVQIAARGQEIDPFLHGVLAASGVHEVAVYRRLRIGVFSSGDELVNTSVPPDALQPGQIYDSNRVTVMRLLTDLEACEVVDLGCLADDANTVTDALRTQSQRVDVLITSGGVSVGDADFITATLQTLGELNFWKLNLKPGKPLAVGRIGNATVFGLPGNPVSTIVTLLLVAKPMIRFLSGAQTPLPIRIPARLVGPIRHRPGRAEYQRGTYSAGEDGLRVTHTGDQSSNRLQSFTHANCLIEVPKDAADLAPGALVNILPLHPPF